MRTRHVWKVGAILVVTLFEACLFSEEEPWVANNGTVEFVDVEGGCWRIRSTDGVNYEPTNLPDGFMVDKLPVRFEGRLVDAATVCMVGRSIELSSIRLRRGD